MEEKSWERGKQAMRIRIKELRIEHGYREQELARLLSISVRTLRRDQSGQTRLPGDTLMKLSAIFGVPPEEILMEEDDANDR